MGKETIHDEWEVDGFGVTNAGPFGGSDDIPAEIWGDPETFDAEAAAETLIATEQLVTDAIQASVNPGAWEQGIGSPQVDHGGI